MLFVEIELAMADEIPEKIFGFINSFFISSSKTYSDIPGSNI